MPIFLANPWGLLAVAGLPAVVALHFLRRKSRRVPASTMFLVDRVMPPSEGGRTWRELRNSPQLWAQLLTVCALVLWLVQPRWIDVRSRVSAAIVMDASASMSAFRDAALGALRDELTKMSATAGSARWSVVSSDSARLGAGDSIETVIAETERNWRPSLGTHDASDALRLARTLAGPEGLVAFVTDRDVPVEATVRRVSIGHTISNAGFSGGSISSGNWTALVRNFSTEPETVSWRVAGTADWNAHPLAVGAMARIEGTLPPGADRIELELGGDAFGFDDHLPLVVPVPKRLAVKPGSSETFGPVFERILRLAEPLLPPDAAADLSLATWSPEAPGWPAESAIVFVEDSGRPGKPLPGFPVGTGSPLMDSLNWQGVIVRDTFSAPTRETDEPLLWQNGRALIFLRTTGGKRQLVFNFDIRPSNAARLPAFALLLHRFFTEARAAKPAFERSNVDTRQKLDVAGVGARQAPDKPAFFTFTSADGAVAFDGAAQFGDTRESDFRDATSGSTEGVPWTSIRDRHALGDAWDPLWALVVFVFMGWNWWLTGPQGSGADSVFVLSRPAARP